VAVTGVRRRPQGHETGERPRLRLQLVGVDHATIGPLAE
jgi:hypothetical protein